MLTQRDNKHARSHPHHKHEIRAEMRLCLCSRFQKRFLCVLILTSVLSDLAVRRLKRLALAHFSEGCWSAAPPGQQLVSGSSFMLALLVNMALARLPHFSLRKKAKCKLKRRVHNKSCRCSTFGRPNQLSVQKFLGFWSENCATIVVIPCLGTQCGRAEYRSKKGFN